MRLEKNLGLTERFVRVVISGFLMVGATYLVLASSLVWLVMLVGSFLMITALLEFCPFYALFKVSSLK